MQVLREQDSIDQSRLQHHALEVELHVPRRRIAPFGVRHEGAVEDLLQPGRDLAAGVREARDLAARHRVHRVRRGLGLEQPRAGHSS